ncbi:MAG: site-specific integrase [Sedimenticola sp.]
MELIPRGKKGIYHTNFTAPNGKRIRVSTQTSDKVAAQEFLDRLKAQCWRESKLGEKPEKSWQEAVCRYVDELPNGASETTLHHIRNLDDFLNGKMLSEIDSTLVSQIASERLQQPNKNHKYGEIPSVSRVTVNHSLTFVKAVLNAAKRRGWIDNVPRIEKLKISKKEQMRVDWLTRDEAKRLLDELPIHLENMARFTLLTGLRESNVCGLRWEWVDLRQCFVVIPSTSSKSGKHIHIPLNSIAIELLNSLKNDHPVYVFTYRGKPIKKANCAAWKKALDRAGIRPYIAPGKLAKTSIMKRYPTMPLDMYSHPNFRWHDLRHTWASWHVQEGTPLAVLQQLGGWASYEMVLRYAHLAPTHIAQFADSVSI